MLKNKILLLIAIHLIVLGCGITAAPPVISSINSGSNIILHIPTGLYIESDSKELHGISFVDTLRYYRTSNNIQDMIGIKFEVSKGMLNVSNINGELFSSGKKMYSSITYKMTTKEEQNDSYTKIVITPYEKIEVQGKDPLFIPYKMPVFTYDMLLENMKNIQFKKEYEFNSEYNVDSIRGNFERIMSKNNLNRNTDYVKLTESYTGKSENCTIDIRAGFFPYQNGSKVNIFSESQCIEKQVKLIDIVKLEKEVEIYIKSIIYN